MRDPENYLVMYSGGLGSWEAARRLVREHGPGHVRGLFADTSMEDPDLYRCLDESTAMLGIDLVKIADGRDIWQVFVDEKFLGNTRVAPCSKILKRGLMDRWMRANCDPAVTAIVFGLDWSERHRIEGKDGRGGIRQRMEGDGWMTCFPLNERPYAIRAEVIAEMEADGLRAPRLYHLGFPHNNCGGFCVKAGHAQMRHLLRTLPDVFRFHERRQEWAMAQIGPSARPFLRDRTGGVTRGVTLREFREQHEAFPLMDEGYGWGCGGGCAVDDVLTD